MHLNSSTCFYQNSTSFIGLLVLVQSILVQVMLALEADLKVQCVKSLFQLNQMDQFSEP